MIKDMVNDGFNKSNTNFMKPEEVAKKIYDMIVNKKNYYNGQSIEFYNKWQYDLPSFLSISSFMKRNNVSSRDILNVLLTAKNVNNLNMTIINLKTEIEKLKQTKNYYSLNQNMQPVPLGPLPRYYNW